MAVDPTSPESVFVGQLPLLERVVGAFGRRYGMSKDEIEDLASSIKVRIVEDDYAVLRKFRGESSLSTYLTVVISMMAREALVQQRGRWRPSAAAQKAGPVAVGLETLVSRKGHSLPEAAALLRSSGATTMSDRELGDLLRRLPRRDPLRPVEVGDEPLRASVAPVAADEGVLGSERAAARSAVERTLESAMASFSLDDRLLLKLRFWQQASIADAARILGTEQRPLYRRVEKLLAELREHLTREGVTVEQVRELIGEGAP